MLKKIVGFCTQLTGKLNLSIPRRLIFLGTLLALCIVLHPNDIAAQSTQPEWPIVLRALQAQRDAVNRVQADYLLEYNLSPEREEEISQANRKAYGNSPMPRYIEEYDRVATCRYLRDGDFWREDISEAYPGGPENGLLHHFQGFDGEKYFAYNDARSRGRIAPTADDLLSVTSRFAAVTNGERFLGLKDPLSSFEQLQDNGISFNSVGQEQANGELCAKYVAGLKSKDGNLYTRVTAWINPRKSYAVVKLKSENFNKSLERGDWNATVLIRNALALEETPSGAYVNKVFQEDYFQTNKDGQLHWQYSWRFTLQNVQIGVEIPRNSFAVKFPPGARVEDMITSPGSIHIVGAEYESAATDMAKGIKLKTEPLDGLPAPEPQNGESFSEISKP